MNCDSLKIAICVVAYNRLESVKRLLKSLEKANYAGDKVDLIISIDKSPTTVVGDYARNYKWGNGEFKCIEHPQNLGLRRHILGIGQYFVDYDALVILEDDIVVSPNFFIYTKQCLEKYKDDERIAGISLYAMNVNYISSLPFWPIKSDYDVYFMQHAQSWGQVWMKKQWQSFFDWYQKNDEEFGFASHLPTPICKWSKKSWLKYHIKYCIEKNKFFVYPYYGLSTNNADPGEHIGISDTLMQCQMQYMTQTKYKLPSFDEAIVKYDGFTEPLFLGDALGIDCSALTVDFYGKKDAESYKRFVLTRKKLDYQIVDSFALTYRPFEINILTHNEGRDVFLYDTERKEKNVFKEDTVWPFYDYMYGAAFRNLKNIVGLKSFFKRLFFSLLRKIYV